MKGDDCAALITKVSRSFERIMFIMNEWDLPVRNSERIRGLQHIMYRKQQILILYIFFATRWTSVLAPADEPNLRRHYGGPPAENYQGSES